MSEEIKNMKKLRELYQDTQKRAILSAFVLNPPRIKSLIDHTSTQLQKFMSSKNQSFVEQTMFYHQKYIALKQIFDDGIAAKTKEADLQKKINQCLKERLPAAKLAEMNMFVSSPILKQEINSVLENDKVRLEGLLSGIYQIGNKHLPSAKDFKRKKPQSINTGEKDTMIKKLESDLEAIKKQKNNQVSKLKQQTYFYKNKVKDVESKLQELKHQNVRLKSQAESIGKKSEINSQHLPLNSFQNNPSLITKQITKYSMDCCPNNLILLQTNKSAHKLNSVFEMKSNSSKLLDLKKSEVVPFNNDSKDVLFFNEQESFYQYQPKKANQFQDKQVRSKIAFFKSEMVVYRGLQFDLAFKKKQMGLQKYKVKLFVQNKTPIQQKIKISYIFDKNCYSMKSTSQKIAFIAPNTQSCETFQIQLLSKNAIETLVQASVEFGKLPKMMVFIPTPFIEFTKIQSFPSMLASDQFKIKPHTRFKTIGGAEQLLNLERQDDHTGVTYGRSILGNGPLILKWLPTGELQVKTIKPFEHLLAFLFIAPS